MSMRAAVLHGIKDLRVDERPSVELGAGEVRVKVEAGGICGSDLHYFHHAAMGDFRVREPFVLGHEAAGRISEIGPDVDQVAVGDAVTINPSHPCGECAYCRGGRELLCENMRFLGSSRKFPHIQGAFTQDFVTHQRQCWKVTGDVSMNVAAFAEPFSVALHAVNQAGPLLGAKVLITGAGPIGCLVLMAAKLAGAAHVTIVDVLDGPLAAAHEVGADLSLNVSEGTDALADPAHPRGHFDVAFDASGNPRAVLDGLRLLRPDGTFVQVGTFGGNPMVPLPTDLIMTKELTLKSSFRFDKEFDWAVRYLCEGAVDISPLLSHQFELEDAMEAFETASDRSRAMKVHLQF